MQQPRIPAFDTVAGRVELRGHGGYGFNSLRQAVVALRTPRRAAGPAHDGASDATLPRAVALRPSVERRLLPRGQRGRRPRSDAVLLLDDRIAGGDRLRRRRDHPGRHPHRGHGAAPGRPADPDRRGVHCSPASRRAPRLGRCGALTRHVRLRRASSGSTWTPIGRSPSTSRG